MPAQSRQLTRRCSRPAAGHAQGLAAQPRAAGLLSGHLVRRGAVAEEPPCTL